MASGLPCAPPRAVAVRFEPVTQPKYYTCADPDLPAGGLVVVQEEKCLESGTVVHPLQELKDPSTLISGKILRAASEDDRLVIVKNSLSARQALVQAKVQVERRQLPMALFHARYSFDRTRLTFQFTAEGRIDFRELLKDLAALFRARIELRQVGAREETRVIGGFGPCGRRTCCSTFLADLRSISIKMAKDQGLQQNPNKVTGLCGKLMCCLRYEVEFYRNTLAAYPPIDSQVVGDNIRGTVIHQNPVKGTVTLGVAEGLTREVPVGAVQAVQTA